MRLSEIPREELGPKQQILYDTLVAEFTIAETERDANRVEIQQLKREIAGGPPGLFAPFPHEAGPVAWSEFPYSHLGGEPAWANHEKSYGFYPVRLYGRDDRRYLMEVIGWSSGASSGEPKSPGHLLLHRETLEYVTEWVTNPLHVAIGRGLYPESGERPRGIWSTQSPPVPFVNYPKDITGLLEFSSPIDFDPGVPILGNGNFPQQVLDELAQGAANGDVIAWIQCANVNTKASYIYNICAWDGEPYLTLAKRKPQPQSWFVIRNGITHHTGVDQPYPIWQVQRVYDPAAIFP